MTDWRDYFTVVHLDADTLAVAGFSNPYKVLPMNRIVCPACCGSCKDGCVAFPYSPPIRASWWALNSGLRCRYSHLRPRRPFHGPHVPQAKDMPDSLLLERIAAPKPPGSGLTTGLWTLQCALRPFGWPDKVVLAKLRSMLRRGLIDGCGCGCSGGFTVKASE